MRKVDRHGRLVLRCPMLQDNMVVGCGCEWRRGEVGLCGCGPVGWFVGCVFIS